MTRQQQKEAQLREAMQSLIQNQNFRVFMEATREMREGAVAYMIDHTTTKDQRESLCAVGEVRMWDTLWAAYQSHLQAIEHQLVEGAPGT